MKAKRLFSFLLALAMALSLSPVPALAEETGESPAFLVQSVSGSRAAGESYVLTWALNRTPDRLELVREATEEEGAAEGVGPYDGDGPVLVLVQELEPERTRLEMPAAEEETIFYLRAFYGEEELLSVGFTVTLDAEEDDTSSGADAPPSPQGEGTEAVGADAPGGPHDETSEPSDEWKTTAHPALTRHLPLKGKARSEGRRGREGKKP